MPNTSTSLSGGALGGLRVLDLTRVLAGPWCTQALADLGADVIKIERPGAGDDTRHWGPPYAKDATGQDTREAAYFLAVNRNKRSVTLDIASPEGQALIRQLVPQCDVLVENYKVGDMARYGLDYDSLRQIHPGLVYCSITGFGQTGPYAPRPGYDFIVQGMGGFMSVTGERDGMPGGGPQKAGVAIADLATGAHAAIAILAALRHRDRTGQGQYLDISLLDVQVSLMANMASNYLATERAPARWGNAHPNIVPYQVFKAADGWVIVACGNDHQFGKLVDAGGRRELASDPRFATNPARVRHREELVAQLEPMMLERTRDAWIAVLEEVGVPCGPINDLADVFADPQVIARAMRLDLPHPTAGQVSVAASALKLSVTPVSYRSAPPLLGQHTDEVLKELAALTDGDLQILKSRAVI
ncbi:L-carnitine dehydratase/bile acid-inducible protein F [Sphaerotilus natans subsp. natans DSM 6575]|uniref:L-carnitine dehydratase/bile acid-inducible protein F n=1 Tax=Sphaerotilus natans subsp. natans DSM 6575 TaxID=1286631 RepID=A0A059KJS1_9BURK|nr:CaiB/BaiF CoA-transferase family protein [Sphaerotilus natans]KDB51701.1 L-carnitine dehydratase/bile acid-inducible protein F [Sphaerotilus natans subsp. natans DSM 6575]SIS04668.1 formyl-CoA transferase [Sphaerotilus natans]